MERESGCLADPKAVALKAALDTYDEFAWDQVHGTTSSASDAIRCASPVRAPGDRDNVAKCDGAKRICGEILNAATPVDIEMAAGSTAPMIFTEVSASCDQEVKVDQQPKMSAMEIRRQKNRDWMRRARQKQRDEVKDMKATVARLEKQYAALSLRSSADESALVTPNPMAIDYSQAVELTRRLGAENLYLKAEIQQQHAWKMNLSRILQTQVEVDGPRWAQQFQQPALGGEEMLRMQLDRLSEFAAREELGFHALNDLDLTHLILENQRTMTRVRSRLLLSSSLDADDGARTRRIEMFGWEMVQRVHGSVMEFAFTKKFRGLDVAQLMQRTWANDMRLDGFKKVKGETCRLKVLQQINPNAYVLLRDVASPTEDIATFRSVFVRFLIETSKTIPTSNIEAPTALESNELMLEATGYVLGTQSVDSGHARAEDRSNKVAWAHLSLSIEFLNVVNAVTAEEYQEICWSGKTDYCGEEHAQRNASDMLQGMLRWELLIISPAIKLVSLE